MAALDENEFRGSSPGVDGLTPGAPGLGNRAGPGTASEAEIDPPVRSLRALGEVGTAFLKLGLFSFGGPIAHLGYFHTEFVRRRRWIGEPEYADLVALCQFLPGPSSSQVVFALGMKRAGLPGALLASLSFLAPSAALMIAFGLGVTAFSGIERSGCVQGLKLAAVVVVAHAVWGMWQSLCPDRARVTVCLAAAALLIVLPGARTQIAVIGGTAFAGWLLYSGDDSIAPAPRATTERRTGALCALMLFALLLVAPSLVARLADSRALTVFDSFYRAGSLVFGGGHVVLPLLRAQVVPRGWITDDAFLAGYGAAQAIPGPLFSFAGYLGTVIFRGPQAVLGGLACLFAIFLPAWLLVGGALPFWSLLRSRTWVRAALLGANAGVVGVLLAALYSPLVTESVRNARDVAIALVAFGVLHFWKAQPIAVVALCAAYGQWVPAA